MNIGGRRLRNNVVGEAKRKGREAREGGLKGKVRWGKRKVIFPGADSRSGIFHVTYSFPLDYLFIYFYYFFYFI